MTEADLSRRCGHKRYVFSRCGSNTCGRIFVCLCTYFNICIILLHGQHEWVYVKDLVTRIFLLVTTGKAISEEDSFE